MDTSNILGEVFEQAGTAVKQTGKAAANAVSDFAQGAVSQLGVPVPDNSQAVGAADAASQADLMEGLYGKTQQQAQAPAQPASTAMAGPSAQSPQDLERIAQIHRELMSLHNETYYDPLVNPVKKEEEKVAEKIEREDKQEKFELQKKEMEKPPELVQRAAQRIEKFPGASG